MKKLLFIHLGLLLALMAGAQNNLFVNYTNGDDILDIGEDVQNIWVGTNGGIVKIDKETEKTLFLNKSNTELPNNYIHGVANNGNLNNYFATQGGMVKYDGSNWGVFDENNSMLPFNYVRSIGLDLKNIIWMGTDRGLASYDGTNWTVFSNENSILTANSVVWEIFIDPKDVKWFGSYDGLYKLSAGQWSHFNTENSGLPSNRIHCVSFDGTKYWIGTDLGIAAFDGTSWEVFDINNSGLQNNNITDVEIDQEGNTWIGTDAGLHKFDGVNWEFFNSLNTSLKEDKVRSLFVDGQNNLWVGLYYGGLFRYDGINWKFFETSNSGLTQNQIKSVAHDRRSAVWIGTENKGLLKFDKTSWAVFNSDNSGMPHDLARVVYVDRQNNKWIGSNAGVSVLDGDEMNWVTYNTSNSGLPDNSVYAIVQDSLYNKWIGTLGGIAKYDGNNWTTFTSENSGLLSNSIKALAVKGREEIWAGTQGSGIAKFDGTTWTVLNEQNSSLPSNYIWDLMIDQNEVIYVATEGGFVIIDGQEWTIFDTENSQLPSNSVYSVATQFRDSLHNKPIWVGTHAGLCKIEDGQMVVLNTENSDLQDNRIMSISLRYDEYWFGTYNGGVAVYGENWTSTEVNVQFSNIINPRCPESNDGKIYTNVSGPYKPLEFLWSNGSTSQNLYSLGSGVYSLTVTDATGASKTVTAEIIAPKPLEIDSIITHPSCGGGSDGSITLDVSAGGNPDYRFVVGQDTLINTSYSMSGLSSGSYSIEVIDGDWCRTLWETTLKENNDAGITGYVTHSGGVVEEQDASVILYDASQVPYRVSQEVRIQTGGYFEFKNVEAGDYVVFVKLDNHAKQKYQGVMNSYYNQVFKWRDAERFNLNCNTSAIEIQMFENPAAEKGNGKVSGYVSVNEDNLKSTSNTNVMVVLVDETTGAPIDYAMVDETGYYEFIDVPDGNFSVLVDIGGIEQNSYPEIIISPEDPIVSDVNYEVVYSSDGSDYAEVVTSINHQSDEAKERMSVFPVPAQSHITIQSSEFFTGGRIRLLGNNGSVVIVYLVKTNDVINGFVKMNISGIDSGMYIIDVETKEGNMSKKVFIVE